MRDGPRSGSRWWAIGDWNLRWKLTTLVALPLAVALVLGGLNIATEFSDASDYRTVADDIAVLRLITDMADAMGVVEGDLAFGFAPPQADIDTAQKAIDQVQAVVGSASRGKAEIQTLMADFRSILDAARSPGPQTSAVEATSRIVDDSWRAVKALLGEVSNSDVTERVGILTDAISSKASLSGELIAAIDLARTSKPTFSDWQMTADLKASMAKGASSNFQIAAEVERALLRALGARLPGGRDSLKEANDAISQREALAYDYVGGKSGISASDFLVAIRTSMTGSVKNYNRITNDAQNTILVNARALSDKSHSAAILGSTLLGIGFLVELVLAGLAARSVIRPLRRLRRAALQVAERDLAAEVDRIKDGTGVEDVVMVPMPVHTTEEVGQLARAVDSIHDQALRLAGEQAQLRLQVSDMFETLARRSKSLVDHQLGVIEAMEYEEKDPKLLEGLFRLDHLAARMRRNSDNLLILAGTKARRTKAAPVEIGDVLRAAISEVEEYQRVKLGATPRGSLTEPAASDIAHLFAELLDNALRASPPETDVKFTFAQANDQGLLIEVADRGIGIPAGDLAAINQRLEAGADISTDTARHMGLFVVSKLAERHGLTVRMRPTFDIARDPGVTVTVHVPRNLIIGSSVVASTMPQTAVRPPLALPETMPSAPMRQVPRVLSVNAPGAAGRDERPSLPQRHRGGALLPDGPLPPAPPKAPPAPPQHGGLPQRIPGAHGATVAMPSGPSPELPQRKPGTSGVAETAVTGDRTDAAEHPAPGSGEFVVGAIHHTSPRGFTPIDDDAPPRLARPGLPYRRPPLLNSSTTPPTAEGPSRPQGSIDDESPAEQNSATEGIAAASPESSTSRPPRGIAPLAGPAVDAGRRGPDQLVSRPPLPGRPTSGVPISELPISERPVFEDVPRIDPAAAASREATAMARATAEAQAEARRAWEEAGKPAARLRGADTTKTASFFQTRIKAPTPEDTTSMPIFAEMMSGWLADWQEGMPRPAFESIADEGWSAAQRVSEASATAVTESGLPQRKPGEWLIPGAVGGGSAPMPAGEGIGKLTGVDVHSDGTESLVSHRDPEVVAQSARRDPESIRASLASHQTGVRNGRAVSTVKATRDEGDQ